MSERRQSVRISYAEVLESAAQQMGDCPGHGATCAWLQSPLGTPPKRCDCWIADYQATLRQLAALVEEAETVQQRIDAGELAAQERGDYATHDLRPLLRVVASLAAGYRPEAG